MTSATRPGPSAPLLCILAGLLSLDALLYGAMVRIFGPVDYLVSLLVCAVSFWLTVYGGGLAAPCCWA